MSSPDGKVGSGDRGHELYSDEDTLNLIRSGVPLRPHRPSVPTFRWLRWAVVAMVCGVLVAGALLWWHDAQYIFSSHITTLRPVVQESPFAISRSLSSGTRSLAKNVSAVRQSIGEIIVSTPTVDEDFQCNDDVCDSLECKTIICEVLSHVNEERIAA